MTAPLAGVRVLEVANMIAAPSAAALLADLGAEVVKVEPLSGDILRGSVLGDVEPDPWFNLDNRGKRGIAVDLDQPEGVAVVHGLAAAADVFITNLTVERQQRFRVTAAEIREVAPRAVHASLSGYGTRGPLADKLAYDMTAFFARGGIQHLVAEPGGPPAAFRPGQGDHTSALALLASILAALRLRDQTGEGQVVEVALYQVATWTMGSDLSAAIVSGAELPRWRRADWPNPMTCRFRCRDGRWLALCMPGPKDFFPAFCEALGHPEWQDDERFATADARIANAPAFIAEIDEVFAAQDRPLWAQRLDAARLTWAPVQDLDDIRADPQAEELGIFALVEDHPAGPFHTLAAPFHIRDADVGVRGRAPNLGEHTTAVLLDAGWSEQQIDDLVARGIVGIRPEPSA
ncbi:MAG: CoA transferase [Acidimicrobiia bacterium]|nr:CoA transferase [Acidimicrobiia bacterium]